MKRILFLAVGSAVCSCLFAQSKQESYIAYIEQYKVAAQEQERVHGVPASITLAQGLLESAAGQSELATQANNHFGIKCTSDWAGETYTHDDETKNECFRKYVDASESFNDHALFLKRPRYASLYEMAVTDYKGWAYGLSACGYATDVNYPEKLIQIIELYGLNQLDSVVGNDQPGERLTDEQIARAMGWEADAPIVEEEKTEKELQRETKKQIEEAWKPVDLYADREVMQVNGCRFIVAKEGDTFESLSGELNISEKTLRSYNDIVNPRYELQAGDKVFLHKKKVHAAKGEEKYYVKKGENIWQVAQNHGMQLMSIYKLNGIEVGQNVRVNQELRLR